MLQRSGLADVGRDVVNGFVNETARLPRWGEMRRDGWDGRIGRDVRV
jgi:hypothetical protein